MRIRLWAFVTVLWAVSAYAGNPKAVVEASFVCDGAKVGPCPSGGNPNSLILASDSKYYGTAVNSGDQASGQYIFGGTVYSVTPRGKFTLLHTFAPGINGKFANGAGPTLLTEGSDGKLYGLTASGGNGYGGQFYGYGVLFRIGKNGTGFQVVHRFCSQGTYCTDGAYAVGLAVGSDGNVYGATQEGGAGTGCGSSGCGTIFRVTPSNGAYEVVFSFTSAYGGFPAGLIPASDGSFYGLTINGNSLFHYVPSKGTVELARLSFPFPAGCPGLACFGSSFVAFGPNGNLYGFYTVYDEPGAAGLFEMPPDGSHLQLLPEFTTTTGPGLQLLLGSDGNFWFPRITGSSKNGDLVALSPTSGAEIETLTPFTASAYAPAEILQASDGSFWGVSAGGIVTGSGHFPDGAVFKVHAGLPPR